MKTAFNCKTGQWTIGWPGRVSRHDVVYLSPPSDPLQGMPVGNGNVGALCWCEDSRIIIAVNKCDLWDDAESGPFDDWKPEEEEHSTTLRHACRLVIDLGMPVFDIFYLSDFRGKISLSDATVSMRAEGPLGSVVFSAFVNSADGILCCRLDSDLYEDVPVVIDLERYGSRTFSHWYAMINRDAGLGLDGTSASAEVDGCYVTHRLTRGEFTVGCAVIGGDGADISYSRRHSHCSRAVVDGSRRKRVDIALVVTEPGEGDSAAHARYRLNNIRSSSFEHLLDNHRGAWQEFWMRSFMESGDDYLDNIWHMVMYYANSSQRGEYPGRLIGGLWGWNRDVQQWNFYFHWNQQVLYWPLNATGHSDLVESYLEYRFRSLPHAREDARRLFETGGAWVSDVTERRGFNSKAEGLNHTPVAQIALDFWRQYYYTQDHSFLVERALPYMLDAAKFFESLFEKGEDGRYHSTAGTGYEGWIVLRDAITELSCGQSLFKAVLQALAAAGIDNPRAARWGDILDNLAPFPLITADPEVMTQDEGTSVFTGGDVRGHAVESDMLLAAGYGIEEKRMLSSMFPFDSAPETMSHLSWSPAQYGVEPAGVPGSASTP